VDDVACDLLLPIILEEVSWFSVFVIFSLFEMVGCK